MRESREEIARRALGSGEGECEVLVHESGVALTRFTHNAIHQNLASDDVTVRVRVVDGARTGVAQTNATTDDALRETRRRARELARFAPPDENAAPLVRNAPPLASADAYDAATATASPQTRARLVAAIVERSSARDLWAAGYVETGCDGITIANSHGTLSSYDATHATLNVKSNGPDATGYAERLGISVAELDGSAAGERAAERAAFGAKPGAVEPGPWTVILEPAAFGELLAYLAPHFSAQALDEGSSFLCDGMDRSYAARTFTLSDDRAHPLLAGLPFDFEGYPRERVVLLENGVARNVVTDATYARRLDRPNTGHGLPAPSAQGPHPLHLVVAAGERSTNDLIASTTHGLLVARFWYIRAVDNRKTIVTGMTRDGVFEIRDGAIVRAVRNMRFNVSILDTLAEAEFARDQARTGGYSYSLVAPAVKLARFTFTSVTDF